MGSQSEWKCDAEQRAGQPRTTALFVIGVVCTFAVAGPRAAAARGVRGAAIAAETSYKLVTEGRDGALEVVVVLGIPLGRFAGNSIVASKGNVQHVVVIVAVAAGDALAEAGGGQRDGCLANHGLGVVIAVLVTPDTVDLSNEILVSQKCKRRDS